MNDWDSVQELFLIAVDLTLEERAVFLDANCPPNSAVRTEVESLLAADGDSETEIAAAVGQEVSLLLDFPSLDGKRVGAYRIVREIGRGGMGAVYLATRDDDEYRKQVAIKVVKLGMDTASVLERFRYERQILANLDHPYIARLLDGGSTDHGLPFFVMEYIDGRPVNVFCRENQLNNRARCELFLRVLEAVSFAHRNLVVHRDLKPGNIFVAGDGTPKLLDFGVAKLLSGDPDAQQMTMTAAFRPFTPEYASPEQFRGLPVSTATDIYSLGAVLYELLTDRRALPTGTSTPAEVELAVCESSVIRPSEIAPTVDTELDDIVLMAMRKEPERRYHSVDQFADDIQRHLDGMPVLARQDSVLYRVRKFVIRNRLQIVAASLILTSLAGGLVVSIWQAHRAEAALQVAESQRLIALRENARAQEQTKRAEAALKDGKSQQAIAQQQSAIAKRQRDIAERETDIAEKRVDDLISLANSTLFAVHDSVAKLPGSMAARQQIVKTTLEYLERLQKERTLDDRMRLALAGAYFKISTIQGDNFGPSLQDFVGAEASLRQAKEILQPEYLSRGNDPVVMTRWIQIESGLGDVAHQAGKSQDAIAIYKALLPICQRVTRIAHDCLECEEQEVSTENRLAIDYMRLSDPNGLEHAARGIALSHELLARHPNDVALKQELGVLLAAAGGTLKIAGQLDSAADHYWQSIQIREDLLARQPADAYGRRNLLVAYGNYAAILGMPWSPNLGDAVRARLYAKKAVTLARESVRSDPQDATARFDLGMSLSRLGTVDPPADGVEESLSDLREAVALIAPVAKANAKSSSNAANLAMTLEYQGKRLAALGQSSEAIKSYRDSLEVLQPFLESKNDPITVQAVASGGVLALAYASSGEWLAAVEAATGAVKQAETFISKPPLSENHAAALARSYATLAEVEMKADKLDQARLYAEKALVLWRAVHNRGVLSIYSSERVNTEVLLSRLKTLVPTKE